MGLSSEPPLTHLTWIQKRPSVNDILATPVMHSRIQKFLSATLHNHEFSHTIIHGKPKPGQLVVQPNLPPSAFPEQMAAAQKAMPVAAPKSVASTVTRPGAAPVAQAKVQAAIGALPRPGAAAPVVSRVSPNAARPPSPRVAASPVKATPVTRPASGHRSPPVPVTRSPQQPPGAARPSSAAAPFDPLAVSSWLYGLFYSSISFTFYFNLCQAKKKEEEAKRARDVAAVGAHREVERMKLEEQRRKLEQVGDFVRKGRRWSRRRVGGRGRAGRRWSRRRGRGRGTAGRRCSGGVLV